MSRYLARLAKISEKAQVTNLQNHQNPGSGGFVGFDGSTSGTFAEKAPPAGTDHERGFVGFVGSISGDFQNTSARSWLLHYPDRDPVLIAWSAPVTHAEALADYPDAVAAEPVVHRPPARRPPTEDERIELLALLAAIYATDSERDRQEAIDCAMADPDGALTCYRAIAAERGLVVAQHEPEAAPAPPACRRCRHRATPGRADPGYCAIRTDQPPAYGTDHPLHRLPDDGGTGCPMFEARQP